MTIIEKLFLVAWALAGLHAWSGEFGASTTFAWWRSAGIVDKILIIIFAVVTAAVSMFLGLISYALWRTSNPRNYR